ncbi:MAG: biotin--[acetyl-CoA-carboxylase] ligase [Fusicatenibacter sp.]|nr:biotin--[acetyl-CoA-carboxylase] ligase [Fusicatenibacter sp.]
MKFDQTTISNAVHTKWAGKTVHFAKEVDSTNEWAKKLGKEGAVHGTLAVAEFQSAGKGRLGRRWTAPPGSSIMMTILVRPDFEPQYAPMLTIVMGLSVAQAAQEMGVDTSIKWPNDVVVSRKKICGILTEMSMEENKIRYVVIGVGINVNLEELPEELADKGTSLYLETGKKYDRNMMLASVMEHFEKNYERFVKTCDLSLLQEEYNDMLANYEQPVRILDPLNPYEGIAHGINRKGELIVEKQDGTKVCVSAGEVSVRGLYSYV